MSGQGFNSFTSRVKRKLKATLTSGALGRVSGPLRKVVKKVRRAHVRQAWQFVAPRVNFSPLWKPRVRSDAKIRIAIVIPWYGKDLGGGAETAAWDYATGMRELRSDVDVHVLTTCLKSFAADWNDNHYSEGQRLESGVDVHRFQALPMDRTRYHPINGSRLMQGGVDELWVEGARRSPLTPAEEDFCIKNMVQSPRLTKFIRQNRDTFDWFIFLPYMFGTTVQGSHAAGDKAIHCPCLHNERYAYMNIYQKMMDESAASIFFVPAEQRLAQKIYRYPASKCRMGGVIVRSDEPQGDGARFRKKYNLQVPYILYTGRKIVGKGLPDLVETFVQFKARLASNDSALSKIKLVIVGKGDLNYKAGFHPDVLDLDFLPRDDMYDSMKGALALCQPSRMESFSIVIMEAWLQGTPCLVPEACEVTRDHAVISGGGFAYGDVPAFEQGISRLLESTELRDEMGRKGRQYVLDNYNRKAVIDRVVGHAYDLRASRGAAR